MVWNESHWKPTLQTNCWAFKKIWNIPRVRACNSKPKASLNGWAKKLSKQYLQCTVCRPQCNSTAKTHTSSKMCQGVLGLWAGRDGKHRVGPEQRNRTAASGNASLHEETGAAFFNKSNWTKKMKKTLSTWGFHNKFFLGFLLQRQNLASPKSLTWRGLALRP